MVKEKEVSVCRICNRDKRVEGKGVMSDGR